MTRKAAAGSLIGLCAAAIMVALTNVAALHTVELKTYDWRLVRTADPSSAHKTSRSSKSTSTLGFRTVVMETPSYSSKSPW